MRAWCSMYTRPSARIALTMSEHSSLSSAAPPSEAMASKPVDGAAFAVLCDKVLVAGVLDALGDLFERPVPILLLPLGGSRAPGT